MVKTTLMTGLLLAAMTQKGMAQAGEARLETALSFEKEGRFEEALVNYERLFDSGASQDIVLKAKLGAGRIYLEVMGEVKKASALFNEVSAQVTYPDLAARALAGNGKALLAAASDADDVDQAASEFEAVMRTYPDSPAMTEALMSSARLFEMQRKYDRAVSNYQALVVEHPSAESVSEAFRRLGRSLLKIGALPPALVAYQKAQEGRAGSVEALWARQEATLVCRLFLPLSRQPPFQARLLASKSDALKLDSPSRIVVLEDGNIEIEDKNRFFRLSPSGELLPSRTASRFDFQSPSGQGYRLTRNGFSAGDGARPLIPYFFKEDKRKHFKEITALAATRYQTIMISARDPDGLYFVDRESGEASPRHASGGGSPRMRLDSEDNFYVLTRDGSAVLILNRWGSLVHRVDKDSLGMKEISDFALDTLDNLYLLDEKGQFIVLGAVSRADGRYLKPLHRQPVLDARSKPLSDLRVLTVDKDGTVYLASKRQVIALR
ncbi:MAG TPA: tetratricopeptide repeat protein [Acidobacteriota bacterium]|nr:tetratricopeptide repeat protein [Acidobacteriota bacterium]